MLRRFPTRPLGYGADSVHGSGIGTELTDHILTVGKEIVDLGVTDPDLFQAMALFEEGIGPDRISDLTTRAILPALLAFNKRILEELGLKGFPYKTSIGEVPLLRNPVQRGPILLVPTDILRKLPVALDWDGIADAAYHNKMLRKRVNEHIAHIWEAKTRRQKSELRKQVLASKDAFKSLLDSIHAVTPIAYDVTKDPDGMVTWSPVAAEYAARFPLTLAWKAPPTSADDVQELVRKIVEQFQFLVETKGLNKVLYADDGYPRHESIAQKLFFGVAHSYCQANDVDLSVEHNTGTGAVDFKFSHGFGARVLVEVKLSTNSKTVTGYSTQIETYKKAEQTKRAIYLVIDVGQMGTKVEKLIKLRNKARERGETPSDLVIVDGQIKPSPSKQ